MLSFTDAQIKNISQSVVDYPTNLAALNVNLAAIVTAQAGLLTKDQSNEVSILKGCRESLRHPFQRLQTSHRFRKLHPQEVNKPAKSRDRCRSENSPEDIQCVTIRIR